MRTLAVTFAMAMAAGCSSGRDEARPAAAIAPSTTPAATTPTASPPPSPSPRTAASPATAALSTSSDPGGFHLDDPTIEYEVEPRPTDRKGKPIELLLRSSPPGAVAAIDGQALGPTPTLWDGAAGRPLDVTFVLPGHATARYRFVPTQSGVVHGTLERLKVEDPDGGP